MQDIREVEVPASTAEEELAPPNETVLDAVGSGTPEAQSELVEAAEEVGHEYFLGLDSYGWVGLAFLVFVGVLIWLKLPAKIADALDARGGRIRSELEEARALRAEAEALLAEQKAKADQSAQDADAILANARREAEAIVADAEKNAAAMVERRREAAEAKIAAAERAAEQELRARVAVLATAAARNVIAEQTDAADRRTLTDRAIADLGTRLN